MEVGEEGDCIAISTLSPPECFIKMGSDVSLIVRDKVSRQSLQTTLFKTEKGEPKQIRTEAECK